MRTIDDRRYKVLNVSELILMNMFCSHALQPGDCVLKYKFKLEDFPEYLEVESIQWNIMTSSWSILLYHPSFPVVPIGTLIDEIKQEPMIEVWRASNTVTEVKVAEYTSWRHLPRLL